MNGKTLLPIQGLTSLTEALGFHEKRHYCGLDSAKVYSKLLVAEGSFGGCTSAWDSASARRRFPVGSSVYVRGSPVSTLVA